MRRRRTTANRRGLIRRMVLAAVVLSLLAIGTFAVAFRANGNCARNMQRMDVSEATLSQANRLERLGIDIQTGQRGYLITHDNTSLRPWQAARADFSREAVALERLAAASGPGQQRAARELVRDVGTYINEFSAPQVEAARRHPDAGQAAVVTREGSARFGALRTRFNQFVDTQARIAATQRRNAVRASTVAKITAGVGASGSVALICMFTAYLTRTIVRPVREVARMAGRLERGDLTVRMPERSPGEIRRLERAFNALASSLETSRAKLNGFVTQQTSLRHVATLIARGAPPSRIFAAVTEEVGRLLGTNCARMLRYEADDTVTVVDSRSEGRTDVPTGTRWSIEGRDLPALVLLTGKPARTDSLTDASGPMATFPKGVRSAVGAPITVDGRLWGVLAAFTTKDEPLPADAESRISDFTDLVATAIANAQNRADLIASRARIVAASDAARRRIEHDLHDGAQQRLVSLGLGLRAAEAAVPPGQETLRRQLAGTTEGLMGVLEDLREISRGLHPAILAKGGLGAALKSLARRATLPVELNVHADRRLAEAVEVALYYAVSEALTNALKHASATGMRVDLQTERDIVRLCVHDDGVGGAKLGRGTGLIGLKDRVEALGGRLDIASPVGEGTSLLITIPLDGVPSGPDADAGES